MHEERRDETCPRVQVFVFDLLALDGADLRAAVRGTCTRRGRSSSARSKCMLTRQDSAAGGPHRRADGGTTPVTVFRAGARHRPQAGGLSLILAIRLLPGDVKST